MASGVLVVAGLVLLAVAPGNGAAFPRGRSGPRACTAWLRGAWCRGWAHRLGASSCVCVWRRRGGGQGQCLGVAGGELWAVVSAGWSREGDSASEADGSIHSSFVWRRCCPGSPHETSDSEVMMCQGHPRRISSASVARVASSATEWAAILSAVSKLDRS